MNAQKESLKKLPENLKKTAVHKFSVCDENESRRIKIRRKQVDVSPSKNQALCAS